MNIDKPKILIIDDIPDNIQILGSFLIDNNYNVSFSTTADESLKLIKKNNYDLILLDIMMPDINGYELCKIIKKNKLKSEIPIIFITAKTDSDSIVEGFKIGAVDYISKPINKFELLSRVKTHIKLYKQNKYLQNINITLEQKVEERTQELNKLNDQLEILEQAKSDFLKLISHELRTPITEINLIAQILKSIIKNSKQNEYIEKLNNATNRLIEISELALLITTLKIETPREYDEILDIKYIIESVVGKYYFKAKEKNLKLDLKIENFNIYGDYNLFQKCVEIVLDNSIKYSIDNSEIIIKTYIKNKKRILEFIDSGAGFNTSNFNAITDVFNNLNIDNHKEGMGLGYQALKMILDFHNGNIEISNKEEGKGAIVKILLN